MHHLRVIRKTIALAVTGGASTENLPAGLTQDAAFLDEVALLQRIPISRRTLCDWRQKRGFPYVRIGRRILYHWESVKSWLLRQQRIAE